MAKKLHEMTPAEYDAHCLAHGFGPGPERKWLGPPVTNPPMPYYVAPLIVERFEAGEFGQLDLFGAAA